MINSAMAMVESTFTMKVGSERATLKRDVITQMASFFFPTLRVKIDADNEIQLDQWCLQEISECNPNGDGFDVKVIVKAQCDILDISCESKSAAQDIYASLLSIESSSVIFDAKCEQVNVVITNVGWTELN